MSLEIEKEVIDKTFHCKRNFECTKNTSNCCTIDYCVNNEVHFLDNNEVKLCNYKIHFGNSSICSCPTRKEIYNKYGL
jgi:hypothetical protein